MTSGSVSGPSAASSRSLDVEADPLPQHLDVGVAAEQRVGHGACELGLVGHQQRDVAQHVDHPGGRGRRTRGRAGGAAASRRQNTSATRCSLDEK